MFEILNILLPLFAIIGFGFVMGYFKFMNIEVARSIGRFVFLVAMPVAVLHFFANATPPSLDVFGLMFGYFISMILVTVLCFICARHFLNIPIREAGAHSFVSTFGNAVFLGLPIAMSIEGWGQPFLMLMIMEGIFVVGIGTALMTWPPAEERANLNIAARLCGGLVKGFGLSIKNPIVISALVGLLISITGGVLPDWLASFLKIMGGSATPSGLFVLGLFMAVLPRPNMRALLPSLSFIALIKLLLFPLITIISVLVFTGGDMLMAGAAGLFTAMPPAVTSFVQAVHYKVYEDEVVAALVICTLFSLLTIPAFIILLA